MKKSILKNLIYINVFFLAVFISIKFYLVLYEPDFHNRNYKNMEAIESKQSKDAFSFAVIGPVENSIGIFKSKMIDKINSDQDIIFTIAPGNAVLDGAEEKYRILNKMLNRLKQPTLLGIGDRELSDGGDARYYDHFGTFYYSFSYGNSYFIFIDTTGKTYYNMQKEWISHELANADQYRNIFVFLNNSPVEIDSNSVIKDSAFRKFLTDEFSTHKVTGVFCNGNSLYDAKKENGVLYYSNGNAKAASLYGESTSLYHFYKVNITGNAVTVQSVNEPVITSNYITRKIENIFVFVQSVVYFQFINFILVLISTLLIALLFYKKVSKEVNYYRNYNDSEENINVKDKLNIAMFTNNYLPFIGGVPISIDLLAEALRIRGNTVVIFAPEYPDPQSENNVFRCKRLFYRKTAKFNFAIANIYSQKINKEFNSKNFDIVHVHHPFWMGKKGLQLAKSKNIPVVLTYHTRLEMYSDNLPVFKLLFKNILSHKIIKNFAQKCDGIIAPTISAKEYLENVGVSRQKLVLPTGVDFKKYNTVDETAISSIRNEYASGEEVLLCSVSRLSSEKNIKFLIKGLRYVKENSNVKFKCIIIGTGPERENIQSLIDELSLSNEVRLIGVVKPAEIAMYYMASDLFVFSSLSETQGMVLLEAMAGKCPVVSVKASGIDDVVRDGYNGYKTHEAIEDWAKKVIYLLENREVLHTMGQNAFSYSQNYSLEKMAERMETFYKKIIIAKNKLKAGAKDA